MSGITSDTETLRDELIDAFEDYADALDGGDIIGLGEDTIVIRTMDAGIFEVTIKKVWQS